MFEIWIRIEKVIAVAVNDQGVNANRLISYLHIIMAHKLKNGTYECGYPKDFKKSSVFKLTMTPIVYQADTFTLN